MSIHRVDPYIYHTVVLPNELSRRQFVESAKARLARDPECGAEFYARTVKVLCLQRSANIITIEYILALCPGVEQLAIWFFLYGSSTRSLELLAALPNVRRLSLVGKGFVDVNCMLPSVTHLNVSFEALRTRRIRWGAVFDKCPHLTHILIDLNGDAVTKWEVILLYYETVLLFEEILNLAPSTLKALIFEVFEGVDTCERNASRKWLGAGPDFGAAATQFLGRITDPRFVFMCASGRFEHVAPRRMVCYQAEHDPLADWGYIEGEEMDAWQMADRWLDDGKRSAVSV